MILKSVVIVRIKQEWTGRNKNVRKPKFVNVNR